MIDIRELCKSYGEVEALKDVTFSVKRGEIVGLLGPNGAGKTTLMKILTGFLHPSGGTAHVNGLDVVAEPRKVQTLLGYLPENAPLYPELTVQSYLKTIADLRGIPVGRHQESLSEAIRAVGLEDRLTQLIGTLSKGYRQRVGLAQAIMHRPKILILDEPTNGLDPTQIVEVRRLIKTLAQQCTVILSTHILSEVEATCDRAVVIMRGKVMADARLSELSASADSFVTLVSDEAEKEVVGALRQLDGALGAEVAGRGGGSLSLRVRGAGGRDLCPDIFVLARDRGWILSELRRDARDLEVVFGELAATDGGVQ